MSCLNCGGSATEAPQVQGITGVQLGSAEEQVAEAMRIAKARNQELLKSDSIVPYIEKMDGMTVSQAVTFLMDQSPAKRERYLQAEKISKARKTVLGHFGW